MKTRRAPTIHDVAACAGVSKSTVSLVLRRSPQVREATRVQVEAAMTSVGYVYNRAAAELRGAAPRQFGLLTSDLEDERVARLVTALQRALAREGHGMLLSVTEAEKAAESLADLQKQAVAGVFLCLDAQTTKGLPDLSDPSLRVLSLLNAAPGCSQLSPDPVQGGTLAAQHLIRAGAGKLALLGGELGEGLTRDWLRGVTEALGALPLHISGTPTRAFGRTCARHLAWAHPEIDGVLCATQAVSIGLSAAAGPNALPQVTLLGSAGEVLTDRPCLSWSIETLAEAAVAHLSTWLETGQAPELPRFEQKLV